MPNTPQISIVIVSYNVKEYLTACIASIRSFDLQHEIIIIDNNSSDGTVAWLKGKFPEVLIIANKENKGFSGANNQGIELAQSENILLLNPDTEVTPDSLNKLLLFLNSQKELCLVAPKLLNTNGTLQVSCWKFPSTIEILLEVFYLHTVFHIKGYTLSKMKNTFVCDSASGAAFLFKKNMISKIGILDSNLFWMEDVDFCYRAQQANIKTFYFPSAEVIHHGGKSSATNQHVAISNQLISKLKFYRKHKSIFAFYISCILVFAHLISRLIILLPVSFISQSLKIKFRAYLFSFRAYIKYVFTQKHEIS